MPRSQLEVEILLQKLEAILRDTELWSATTPGAEALLSKAPFACDTLLFEQWLQFIFIPRLRECMQLNHPLPNQMGLYPMGQQCFIDLTQQKAILPVLAQIDLFFKE